VKKLILFLIIQIIFFSGCNKGCTDENACNYDLNEEPCKYSDKEEAMLEGEWSLVYIRDVDGDYLFSSSDDTDYELDDEIKWITLDFDDDNTCEIQSGQSKIEDNIYTEESDWSINACFERLNFRNLEPVETETNTMHPDYWPFGYFVILQLDENIFICEDANQNVLRWERE
tara:strand:- start:470 stop:985 length:516 start_codon:yes stop_codon:yes gene_type:complete